MFRTARDWLNLKVVVGAIVFAICLFAALVAILWSARADSLPRAASTARLSIIDAALNTPTPHITITPTPEPSSSQAPIPPGGNISLGELVQVAGTGGDGLRIHVTAGVAGEVQYIAIDSEVFRVKEGPVEADGYSWWLLEDPYTEKTVGWGASNYLVGVQNP